MNTEVRGATFQKSADWKQGVDKTTTKMLAATNSDDAFNTLLEVGDKLQNKKIGWFYGKLAIVNTTKNSKTTPAFTRNWMSVSSGRNTRTQEVVKQLFEKSAEAIQGTISRENFLEKVNAYLRDNRNAPIRGGRDNRFTKLVQELKSLREAPMKDASKGGQHLERATQLSLEPSQEVKLPGPQSPKVQEAPRPDRVDAQHLAPDARPFEPPALEQLAQSQAQSEPAPDPWIKLPENSAAAKRAASVYVKRSGVDLRHPASNGPGASMPRPLTLQAYPKEIPPPPAPRAGQPEHDLDQEDINKLDDVRSKFSEDVYEDRSEVADLDEPGVRQSGGGIDKRALADSQRRDFINSVDQLVQAQEQSLSSIEHGLGDVEIRVERWISQSYNKMDNPGNAIRLQSADALLREVLNPAIEDDLTDLEPKVMDSLDKLQKLSAGVEQTIKAATEYPNPELDERVALAQGTLARLEARAQEGQDRLGQVAAKLGALFDEIAALRDEQLDAIVKENETLSLKLEGMISKSADDLEKIAPRLREALEKQEIALSGGYRTLLNDSNRAIANESLRLMGRHSATEPEERGIIDELEDAIAEVGARKTSLLNIGVSSEDPLVTKLDDIAQRAQLRLDEARSLSETAVARHLAPFRPGEPAQEPVQAPVQAKSSGLGDGILEGLLGNSNLRQGEPNTAVRSNVNSPSGSLARLGEVLAYASGMIGRRESIDDRQRGLIEAMINQVIGNRSEKLSLLREPALDELDQRIDAELKGLEAAIGATHDRLTLQVRQEVATIQEQLSELESESESNDRRINAVKDIRRSALEFEKNVRDAQDLMDDISAMVEDDDADDLTEAQEKMTKAGELAQTKARELNDALRNAALNGYPKPTGLGEIDWAQRFTQGWDEALSSDDPGSNLSDFLTELADDVDKLGQYADQSRKVLEETDFDVKQKIETQNRQLQTAREAVANFTSLFGDGTKSKPGPLLVNLGDALMGNGELQPALNAFSAASGPSLGPAFDRLREAIVNRETYEADCNKFDRDLERFRKSAIR